MATIAGLLDISVKTVYACRNRMIGNMGFNTTSSAALMLCRDLTRLPPPFDGVSKPGD